MEQSPKASRQPRKPYVKPSVMRFALRPEEAVLGFCKSASSTGPTGAGCTGTFGICRTRGS